MVWRIYLTSWHDEPVGHVDDRVEVRVIPDVVLDLSTEVPEQAVDPLGQSSQLPALQLPDESGLRVPVLWSP